MYTCSFTNKNICTADCWFIERNDVSKSTIFEDDISCFCLHRYLISRSRGNCDIWLFTVSLLPVKLPWGGGIRKYSFVLNLNFITFCEKRLKFFNVVCFNNSPVLSTLSWKFANTVQILRTLVQESSMLITPLIFKITWCCVAFNGQLFGWCEPLWGQWLSVLFDIPLLYSSLY